MNPSAHRRPRLPVRGARLWLTAVAAAALAAGCAGSGPPSVPESAAAGSGVSSSTGKAVPPASKPIREMAVTAKGSADGAGGTAGGSSAAFRPDRALAPIAISPADVDDAVNSAPNDFNLRMEAAGYYLQHGLFPQAVHDLQVAGRLRPKSGIAAIALADALSAGGQEARALETYRRAIALTSGSALAYRGLGQLYVREGKLAEAQKVLEAGLKSNPGDADVEIALGNLYLVLEKNHQAGAVLTPAAKQRPQDADVHYLLGLVDERNLHINAALKEARTAAALDPSLYEAWGSIGLYEAKLEHYGEARAALLRAIQLAPHNARYYQLLGDAYVKDLSSPGNVERGIRCYYQALAENPNDVKSLISLGTALTDRNLPADRKAAIPVLKRVIALRPSDKEPLYRLAQVYRSMEQNAEAARLLLRFSTLATVDERQRRKTAARAANRGAAFAEHPATAAGAPGGH